MPMISIGDLSQSQVLRYQTTKTKEDITRYAKELTDGKVSDSVRHLAGDIGPLLAIDSSLARLNGYGAVTRELGLFADAMQTGL